MMLICLCINSELKSPALAYMTSYVEINLTNKFLIKLYELYS